MNKILTTFNAKHASKVRNINSQKVYTFEYCAVHVNNINANPGHRLTDDETGEQIEIGFLADRVMKYYEVIEWKQETNLEDLYESMVSSYGWSSMDPERNARVVLHGYEQQIDDDLKEIPEAEHEAYVAEFKNHIRTIISRNSRVASSFVTGAARFNNRRNERANNSYSNAVDELNQWREHRMKAIKKAVEAAKPQAQRDAEEWKSMEKTLLEDLAVIEAIDETGHRRYSRANFVNSIVGKAGTLAKNGKTYILEQYMATVQNYNDTHKKPAISARHSFWKLKEELEKAIERQEDNTNRENVEIETDVCTIVKNYEEDRLQLIFDGKPEYSMIQQLKSNGFRWSPRFTAWQRQLTDNAYFAASRITGMDYQEIRKAV